MVTRLFTFLATVLFVAGSMSGTLRAEDPPSLPNDIPVATKIGAGIVEAPLDVADGLPIVSAQINGRGPFRILIDTASRRMIIDDDLLLSAALKLSGITDLPVSAGARAGSHPGVRVDTVLIGTALFSGIDAALVNLDAEAGGKRSYDAVVGLPFFTDCVVTINYAGGNLLLNEGELSAPDGRSVVAFTLDRDRPMISVGEGDRKFTAGLETAALGALTLAPKDRKKVPTQTVLGLVGDPSRFISDVDMTVRRSKDPLMLAGVRFSALPVNAGSGSSSVGSEVLRLFTVAFDVKHGRVRFQSTVEAIDMTPVSRFGYVFSREGKGLVVDAIFPGSMASRQAVAEGDYVRTFERKPLRTYSDDDLRHLLRTERNILLIVDKQGVPLMVMANSTDQ